MAIPIWQTTYYTTTADTLQYTITDLSNVEMFTGKAYKMPGETNLKVNISDICAPYVGTNTLPDSVWTSASGATVLTDTVKTFVMTDMYNNELSSYTFIDDWTYRTSEDEQETVVINGHYAPGMICLEGYALVDDYDEYAMLEWGLGTASTLYTVSACGKAALYYKGRNGCWASFLIEGYVKTYDDYAWSKYKKFNPSTESVGRGETVYLNEIQPRWELNTGWLSDEESKILASDLLSSPSVYLHLLTEDLIVPVTITNTNTEYKEYRKSNRKPTAYQITVQAANKMIRR